MGTANASAASVVNLIEKPGFFKKLVDSMEVGVIVADHEGYIVYINGTYAKFLGIEPESQIGIHASKMGVNSRLHIVARTGQAEINYPHQLKDRGYLVQRIPIKEDGRVMAVLGLVLFDSASTASKLAEQVSIMESKLDLYENELLSLRSTRYTIESIVGVSAAIAALKRHVLKAAATTLPVIITGESGTGKELLAQAIHHASSRRPFPFVRVNCAAIPRDLFESELFGYEKGAFTGARQKGKPGKFELAHRGSMFLDEIGDLPLDMQPKLLRVLEEKEFERIGGNIIIKADFRLLAATNHDLEQMLEDKVFREDLFYRLNVVALPIPPLRERKEDILPIARHLLERITQDAGMPMVDLNTDAEQVFLEYDWPGNVREMSNALERAVFFAENETIRAADLPPFLYRRGSPMAPSGKRPLKFVQDEAEIDAIKSALKETGYNKARAADRLGIHRSLLYKKMKKYHLPLQPDA
jgi:transcriptional regulator with PAS, ATPase and Fis domain